MSYLLAVDGGGTKTEFCISNEQGKVLGSFTVGSSSFKSVGLQESLQQLQMGMKLLQQKYRITAESITMGVFGMSGCDSEQDFDIIFQQIKALGFNEEKIHLCNDGVLAFYAQALQPGIVVIAGTGSIVLGIEENGQVRRAGGWGYNFSDIGSGFWIGCQVLEKTLLYCDNCYEYDPVFEQMKDHFKATDFVELPYKITEIRDRIEITQLSRYVVAAASSGSCLSMEILKQGAEHLACMVKSVYDQMKIEKIMRLVCSGGVLTNEIYLNLLKKGVQKKLGKREIQFYKQINRPVFGGVKLAVQLYQKR